MGLADVQRVLARAYTDAAFRERLLADPRRAAAEMGLAAADAEQLARLSAAQVKTFAASLRSKRRNEAGKLLPHTVRALSNRYAALFDRHAQTHVPSGINKPREDALAFADFLLREGPRQPVWLADLVRYEGARLEAHGARRVTWCRLRYAPDALIHAAAHPGEPPPRQATLLVWYRPTPRGRLHHAEFSLPAVGRKPARAALAGAAKHG